MVTADEFREAREAKLHAQLSEAKREREELDEEATSLETRARQARARHRSAARRCETIQLELDGQMKLFEEES